MGYWLKLYTDILDDPKYFKLSKEARLGMYELLLVAKKIENGELTGQLPCIEDIAFYTRRSVEEWQKVMPELVSIGVIEDGETPSITNYVKRQEAISNEERYKQYKKKRNANAMQRNPTESVGETDKKQNTDKKQIRVDADADCVSSDLKKSELVNYFCDKSGIPLGTGGIEKWNDALIKLNKAGIQKEDIFQAIEELRSKNMTIATLQSIVTPAVMAKANRKPNEPDYKKYLKGEYGEFGSH